MSESASVFNHTRTTDLSPENLHSVVEKRIKLSRGSKRKQPSQQQRQLLSCTKCRERKVKCDRTKPCSACCARGAPKQCEFKAESGDYAPILQSYELRKLRAENLRLKERLRASKIPIDDDDEAEATASPEPHSLEMPASSSHKRRTARHKKFQGSEWSDSIYFGSPGLANVINDFANVNLTPLSTQSLAHLMPRGADIHTPWNPPPYPFATLFKGTLDECIPELLSVLPQKAELHNYLDAFQKRVHVCSFPHIPMEITKSEVERFLSDGRKNAQMCPDMLALLLAALALGSQHYVWDKCGGQWVASVMKEESQKGDVYMAAAMQALRMASFMHKPTLLGIQALIMIGPYLTNSGRFLDAWTLFGTTIRLAQSIGLHRHPKYLDPAPPSQRECSIRQTLWWWMLHMDQQYSMTLGRPLGISGIGDCPPPHELTTNPTVLRFGEFGHHFTVLARQILSSDSLSNAKIDEFTDALRALLDTMPESLQFHESWIDESKEIPEWPLGAMAAVFYCKIHNYLILLNRQRLDKHAPHSCFHPGNSLPPPTFHAAGQPAFAYPSPTSSTKVILRGRPLVLSSSEDLLTAFLFFYTRMPAALICWDMGQQAFNSCMILILDAMETADLSRIGKVEKAFAVFTELDKHGVHKLANLAVERMSWGLAEIKRMMDQMQVNANANASRRESMASAGGGHMQMQDAAEITGSEATQGSGSVHDTVMGNTGMLLLEDPGLQSFVPEAFEPLTWVVGGTSSSSDSEDAKLMHLQMQHGKEEEHQEQGERRLHEEEEWDRMRTGSDPRFSEGMLGAQSMQGSASGSAPARYATFFTAPSQDQGPDPTSSRRSPESTLVIQHHHQRQYQHPQGQSIETSVGQHRQITPPHPYLRQHSYPSLRQHVSAPPTQTLSPSLLHRKHSYVHPHTSPHQPSPTILYTPSVFSPLQTLPESQTIQMNHTVHPSWAARPVAPISSVSEPSIGFALVPAHGMPGSSMFGVEEAGDVKTSMVAGEGTAADCIELERWKWAGTNGYHGADHINSAL